MADMFKIKFWRAFSILAQTAFGTATDGASIDRCVALDDPEPAEVNPIYENDKEEVGKGHAHPTRLDVSAWDAAMTWKGKLTSLLAGWLASFGLGDVTTVRLQKVGSVTFAGAGKETMTAQGTVTPGSTEKDFVVKIAAGGASFDWSNDDGSSWEATGVAITGAAQALEDGVTVTFADLTGYTADDTFSFSTENIAGYQHTVYLQDPANGMQLPSASIVEYDGAGEQSLIRDLVIDTLKFSGEMNKRVQFDAALVGSGHKAASVIAQPSVSAGSFLWNHGAVIQLGESASLATVTNRVKSWEVSLANNLDKDGGYPPGCGLYRSELKSERQDVGLSLTLKAAGVTERTQIEANTLLKAIIGVTGALIDGGYYHKIEFTFEQMKYTAVKKGWDKGVMTYALTCEPLYYASHQGVVKIVVTNAEPYYLVAP
jgi:hypothetical protein